MKLVDILARELKEWPESYNGGATGAVSQDRSGELNTLDCGAENPNEGDYDGSCWKSAKWTLNGGYYAVADDNDTAIVTRAEWQAAVDALKPDAQQFARDYVEQNKGRYVKEWTGEGLPPVGAGIEYLTIDMGEHWCLGKVSYIGPKFLVVTYQHPTEGQSEARMNHTIIEPPISTRIRPIRTPEQIAEEEREGEVNRMVATASMLDKGWARKVCESLYDAGYRKQVAP